MTRRPKCTVGGYLEVGVNHRSNVVINCPHTEVDENGWAHWIFSPEQARKLAYVLLKNAETAEAEAERQNGRKTERTGRKARKARKGRKEGADSK